MKFHIDFGSPLIRVSSLEWDRPYKYGGKYKVWGYCKFSGVRLVYNVVIYNLWMVMFTLLFSSLFSLFPFRLIFCFVENVLSFLGCEEITKSSPTLFFVC